MPDPKLLASFKLDAEGKPLFEADSTDLKHYEIELKVEGAPDDVYGATFELDPTYYDPVRSVLPEDGAIGLETTSYGDYVVTVRLRSKSGALTPLKASLSRVLRDSYEGGLTPAVRQALNDIARN